MASSVARPVPPGSTEVVCIVEAGTSFDSAFVLFLVSKVAEKRDQADLEDEDDNDYYDDCSVTV